MGRDAACVEFVLDHCDDCRRWGGGGCFWIVGGVRSDQRAACAAAFVSELGLGGHGYGVVFGYLSVLLLLPRLALASRSPVFGQREYELHCLALLRSQRTIPLRHNLNPAQLPRYRACQNPGHHDDDFGYCVHRRYVFKSYLHLCDDPIF